jgi:hypothetical protein
LGRQRSIKTDSQMGLAPRETSTVFVLQDAGVLGKLLHRSVNRKYGRQIRLFRVPFLYGLNHCGPPHASYTGLYASTATKS